MKKMTRTTIILAGGLLLYASNAFAIYDEAVEKLKKQTHKSPRSAAECAPATTVDYLNFNNVNALIETGGRMWQDRPNSAPAYEVPQFSGKTAIYSGALWMGGTDVNDQLKIAAMTYGQGTNDFWTGPLTTDGSAEITPDVCRDYDEFFHITRQEVVDYIDYWNCNLNPDPDPALNCDDRDFSSYSIPKVILEWPAHGDVDRGQDYYLAPFFDANGNGAYDPEGGDYPYYDLNGDIDCRAVRDIRLFGDDTYWWVFNDKGNIHTETNGQSIGMEVRAQAFAFATNDEVNDMTFYNYELINRSTFTLFNTYFGQWVDPDIGCADDDYVGCDVGRGLGFAYNGDNFDADCRGVLGYGDLVPAIGVDFFEGPYQDNDSINNLVGIGDGEALNGIGYLDLSLPKELQDSIIDNERYGMRRFVYYDRGGDRLRGDPQTALEHYNYLRSIWRDGSKMVFGGQGHPSNPGATNIECDFMFPGPSDPLNWGTRGTDPGFEWDEIAAGNPPFDRRFIQSAGPFTLTPGAVNDITVGVVFAQAASGDNYASVEKMINADRKAQALFDNCFDVLDGPDAPDLSGVELDQEIILVLSNKPGVSNNYKKFPGDYEEEDPFIITPDGEEPYDNKYRFQGYQIYQVSDASVSVSDLDDPDRARIAFQCDIKDEVANLINFEFSEELNASVPVVEVENAANQGIQHTFRATNDLFAVDDPRLVNFKTYYYIAIAYAHNEFKPYIQDDPEFSDGQKLPYISSRKSTSGAIKSVAFTPHPQSPKYGGMIMNAAYGDQPDITRVEGRGNSGNPLAFTPATLETLLENSFTPGANQPTYIGGNGPVTIKVVDPTSVVDGNFTMQFYKNTDDEYEWKAWRVGEGPAELNDTVYSQTPVTTENEQIVPQWGVSIVTNSVNNPNELMGLEGEPDPNYNNGFINATISYTDSARAWLSGVEDLTGTDDQNWIRSGTANEEANADNPSPDYLYNSYFKNYVDNNGDDNNAAMDPFSIYSGLIGGTWGPFRLAAYSRLDQNNFQVSHAPGPGQLAGIGVINGDLENLSSVQIVITSNKEYWTRCPVLEMQDNPDLAIGNATKNTPRLSPSVDKDGNPDGSGTGMGWFPGYAIDLETGERLNMAFGEDSWLGNNNGSDMLWNPTSTMNGGFTGNPANPGERERVWGGKHYVYVFGNTANFEISSSINMPSYDEGQTLYGLLSNTDATVANTFTSCIWVGMPMVSPNGIYLDSDVSISLRVDKPYRDYESDSLQNNGMPMYRWNMENLRTQRNVTSVAESALDIIRVVPNPYYAFATHYEQNQLDNFVKITNLPERCTVSIYNVSGTLIRRFNKSDPSTEIRWDLVNQSNVPIASGLYLIHVDAPGIGEKIVKWFGVLRPVDLQGF